MNRSLKFGLVGILNSTIDVAIFAALTAAGLSTVPAQCLSYGSGVANSYLWNRNWTFQGSERSGTAKELIRFVIVNLAVLAITTVLLAIMRDRLQLGWAVSKLFATGAGIVINYAGSHYWVFNSRQIRRSESL